MAPQQIPDVGTASAVLRFVGWMAERYKNRTSWLLWGFRFGGIADCTARDFAAATFEVAVEDGQLNKPPAFWTREDANELVDEDMRHWDAV